jgi:hypothetical protein
MANPTLNEMMARTQMVDMRRAAAGRAGDRHRRADSGPKIRLHQANIGVTYPVAVRRAVGWFLVSVGLRVAGSPSHSAPSR